MSVELYRTVTEFRSAADQARASKRRLAVVPTMGALHAGHRALMREAARRSEIVAVTIFVNPTQFGPNEDFERYPRDLEGDLAVCRDEGVTLVFAPSVREMYPAGECTRVRVKSLTEHLCGASRPGHFDGVTTIVAKLFAVAGPCIAVFGRKDYQQLKVIERMSRDLLLPVQIVGHSTVRESDGLALSSRNAYLSVDERRQALAIPRALSQAARRFSAGERRASALLEEVDEALDRAGLRVDYASVTDPEELQPFASDERVGERALLAVAAFVGVTRLIDNVVLGEDAAPIEEPH
jgi:pantoate--beta-alanine ligase